MHVRARAWLDIPSVTTFPTHKKSLQLTDIHGTLYKKNDFRATFYRFKILSSSFLPRFRHGGMGEE
jgi:hypothetical protein